MKRKTIIVLAMVLITVLVASIVYDFTFNSKHRDIANEKAAVMLSAQELYINFKKNEATATAKFLDQVVALRGEITAVENNGIILNNQIQIHFDTEILPTVVKGTSIRVKGRCVGYDDLLEMVKIDQATLIHN
ncbi:MAG: hypothetical protein WA775_00890 [Psychroserpens sp.]|uniref:OB-fold protein n=1 Tax=Psychroserpens sp. TaxID=2020870 RepID=UPI003CBA737B